MSSRPKWAVRRGRTAGVAPAWRRVAVACAALLSLLSGCASTAHEQLVAFLRAHEADVSAGRYVVQPPDAIRIHAPGAEEIDGTAQTVRPDGKVVLRLLGEVDVAGLSTQEIADKLKAQLSRYYVDPEVVVEVAGYRSQFYYVFGQVEAPGPKPFTGRDTVLMALAEARPTFIAWRAQVRVTRPEGPSGERKTIIVDLDRMIATGDASQNILLQEGDIIEVPPTPLGWVGLRMRELLYPLEPAVRAYNAPAEAIDSYDTYRDHNDDGGSSRRRWRR